MVLFVVYIAGGFHYALCFGMTDAIVIFCFLIKYVAYIICIPSPNFTWPLRTTHPKKKKTSFSNYSFLLFRQQSWQWKMTDHFKLSAIVHSVHFHDDWRNSNICNMFFVLYVHFMAKNTPTPWTVSSEASRFRLEDSGNPARTTTPQGQRHGSGTGVAWVRNLQVERSNRLRLGHLELLGLFLFSSFALS